MPFCFCFFANFNKSNIQFIVFLLIFIARFIITLSKWNKFILSLLYSFLLTSLIIGIIYYILSLLLFLFFNDNKRNFFHIIFTFEYLFIFNFLPRKHEKNGRFYKNLVQKNVSLVIIVMKKKTKIFDWRRCRNEIQNNYLISFTKFNNKPRCTNKKTNEQLKQPTIAVD